MKQYDLIVVGGGISGVAAAVCAGREGLKVLLVEKSGCLGGALSLSLVYPFMPSRFYIGKESKGNPVNEGVFAEMRKRMGEYGDSSYEAYKIVFDDMLTEAGVDILFHSLVYDVKTEDKIIKSVKIATKSGTIEMGANFFIDATGDGELIFMSGCDYQLGRESDGLSQPMTTCFRLSGVDVELFIKQREKLQKKYEEYKASNKISNPRENILVFFGLGDGIIHFNTTRVIKHNPVDPFELSRAEIIARKQVLEMVNFLKENSDAFKNASIASIANTIGVRESRKLKGVYILKTEDIVNLVDFDDSIAIGNYGIDIHNPAGTGTTQFHMKDDEYYKIPYRSLLPKEYNNMLVAGRCLSATHEAHSAVRIMPICACLGEAAGLAVAVAKKTNANAHTVDIKKVQQKLKENNARF